MSITSDILAIAGICVAGAVIYYKRDDILAWLSGPKYIGTPGTGITIPSNQVNAAPGTFYTLPGGTGVRVSVPTDPAGYSSRDALVQAYCQRNAWDRNFCEAVGFGGG